MLLAESQAQGFGEPIGILALLGLLEPLVVERLPGDGLKRIAAVIVTFALLHVQFFQGVAEVVTREVRRLDGKAAVVRDAGLVVGEGLGLDDNHTVGTLRSVDGLGRGVLQDGDALDEVHVHIGHFFQRGFETVEDEQRLVGLGEEVALEAGRFRCQRGGATDLHGSHRIGVGTGFQVVQNH